MFVPIPVGEVRVGPLRLCRKNDAWDGMMLPVAGDEVFLFPTGGPDDPENLIYPVSEVGAEFVLVRGDTLMIPKALEGVSGIGDAHIGAAFSANLRRLTR